ncbi:MAG TPA: flagellar assembly protein FliW [Miltoncostaeaceae bacterium]|nr:flagellar assembly protein FliW [Miltoncostaeaceae bacterium]
MSTATVPSSDVSSTTIVSQTLGELEVSPAWMLELVEPLSGFPRCHSYALVPHVPAGATNPVNGLAWLQALDAPYHAFMVADPWGAFPDYAPEIPDADAGRLAISAAEQATIYVLLAVNDGQISANLRAPLVVNHAERRAKQVVLLGDTYQARHILTRAV